MDYHHAVRGYPSPKYNYPVGLSPGKEWERHKDIPRRFDQVEQPDWVEVKEIIKTQKETEVKRERSKPKPPTDSEDEEFRAPIYKTRTSPNRPEYKNFGNRRNASESSSLDSVTNRMVDVGLGKAPSKMFHPKMKKHSKNQEIGFRGKVNDNVDHKSYPKEKHPKGKTLHIPPADYTDTEEQGPISPSQKYYYEKLLFEGIPDSIPRPKLIIRQKTLSHTEYNDVQPPRLDEIGHDGFDDVEHEANYGDRYGDSYSGNYGDNYGHELEYVQEYETYDHGEQFDFDPQYDKEGRYYASEYLDGQYQEPVEGYNQDEYIPNEAYQPQTDEQYYVHVQ